jgi:hypothetical protein
MMGLLIRFFIGLILGGALVIWGGIPSVMGALLTIAIGLLTAIWGDDFLFWFMKVCRLLRR